MKKTKAYSILFVAAMITVLSTIRIYAMNDDDFTKMVDMMVLTNTVVDALEEAKSTPKNKEKIVERLKKEFSVAEENLNAAIDDVNGLAGSIQLKHDRFLAIDYKTRSAQLALSLMMLGNCYLFAGRDLSERNFLESAKDTFRDIITNYSGRSDLQRVVKQAEFALEDVREILNNTKSR